MPRSYAPQFRAMVIEHVRNGRRVADVAASVDLPQATVFRWVRQDRIDRGELPGTSTQESTELRAARRRIAELVKAGRMFTLSRRSKMHPPVALLPRHRSERAVRRASQVPRGRRCGGQLTGVACATDRAPRSRSLSR